MTGVQLAATSLGEQIPALLSRASVVAIVPATELRGWSASMAWQVARAAANAGRRTVLVDCFVDQPTLHGVDGANTEGLVDAFEYGASLNRIVQQQPQADLFFIPAGTYAADADPVLQNPRWRRLSAGFRHEEALLLLYVAAEHLAGLAAEPDGVVVLAPQGQDLAVAEAPALAEAIARGLPLLAVVGENVAQPKLDEDQTVDGSREMAADPEHHHRWMVVGAGVLLALLAVGTAVRFGATRLLVKANAMSAASPITAPPSPITSHASPITHQPSPSLDSLPWTVPLATVADAASAVRLADTVQSAGAPAIITPIGVRGHRLRYRVSAGPFATEARADSALARLAARGYARGGAAAARAPMSIALGSPLPRARAADAQARLRRAGVPAFLLGRSDGLFQLYAGAWDDQKVPLTVLTSLLTPTGSAGAIVLRAGYVP